MSDYEKLKEIIAEIDSLRGKIKSSAPEFCAWKTKIERFLIKKYGEKSFEYSKFKDINFSLGCYGLSTPDSMFVDVCARGLAQANAILETYLPDTLEESKSSQAKDLSCKSGDYSKIFIVHGHDGELKQSIARLIEQQSIKAIILSEQANQGKTVIEKIEKNSDVSAAICLFTADDNGKANKEKDYKSRARQNVVFEAGFFMGKLGRKNVVFVADKEIEIPSDLQGIVYADKNNWQINVLKELKAIGYAIDFNILYN